MDKKNNLRRTHNVKDESTKHECIAETTTQLALQFKQSKSKIQYFEKRQRVKDDDAEKLKLQGKNT